MNGWIFLKIITAASEKNIKIGEFNISIQPAWKFMAD
jgi:hypothetical protein